MAKQTESPNAQECAHSAREISKTQAELLLEKCKAREAKMSLKMVRVNDKTVILKRL